MVCETSKKEIERCLSGTKLVEWLTISMWQPTQLSLLFQLQLHSPVELARMFVTNKPGFSITATHITWYKLHIPYSALMPHTICIIQQLHKLHRERRNMFHETITNVYTIKYDKCMYNTLIEQKYDSRIPLLCLAAYFPSYVSLIYEELLAIKEEYCGNISIIDTINSLVAASPEA